jgi:hypothetical protein
MTFKIEFSDQRFRVVAPNGDYEEAVGYCSFSSVEVDGDVYVAFLTGDEPELDALTSHPTDTVLVTEQIKVYKVLDFPALESVDTEIEEIDFEEDEPTVDTTASPVVPS